MNPDNYIKEMLPTKRVLQLATSKNNMPWLCTVHFYNDEQGNIYWVSTKERRHSRELLDNKSAVATVVMHEDSPEEDYVISITIEGHVELINDPARIDQIATSYIDKLGKPSSVFDKVKDADDSLQLYCLKPHEISVFDNKNFPDNPKQEFNII